MNGLIDQEPLKTSDFFAVGQEGAEAWARDRERGAAFFLREGEGSRIDLVASILDAWLNEDALNRAMASGALRHAWDSEPYIGGIRIGSYVTAAVSRLSDGYTFGFEEFVEEWGASLMTEAEERQLEALKFPVTVYRGGTGTFEDVASGLSWTLKREIASFYANEWPRRWGRTATPIILSSTVTEDDVFAFLNDRREEEVLVPFPTMDAIVAL